MKFVAGSDYAGYPLKASVVACVRSLGHEVVNVGSWDE